MLYSRANLAAGIPFISLRQLPDIDLYGQSSSQKSIEAKRSN
jgi:hypothetical protein